jgi:hypothetical protein
MNIHMNILMRCGCLQYCAENRGLGRNALASKRCLRREIVGFFVPYLAPPNFRECVLAETCMAPVAYTYRTGAERSRREEVFSETRPLALWFVSTLWRRLLMGLPLSRLSG